MEDVADISSDIQEQLQDLSLGLNSSLDEYYLDTSSEDITLQTSKQENGTAITPLREVICDSTSLDLQTGNDSQQSTLTCIPDYSELGTSDMDSPQHERSDCRVLVLKEAGNLSPNESMADESQALGKVDETTAVCKAYTEFLCDLCNKPLRDPRMLDCLHAFCLQCLEVKVEIESNEGQKITHIKCPSCKRKTKLSEEGVNVFPANAFLQNMATIAMSLHKRECGVCKLQDKVALAVSFCTDCNDLLCEDCATKHTFTRFTLSHKVLPMDQAGISGPVLDRIELCPKHNKEQLKFFCKTCNETVCRDCILLDHQNHTSLPISTIAVGLKKDFVMLMMGLTDKLDQVSSLQEETVLQDLDTAEEKEVDKIRNIVQCLINDIKEQERVAIDTTHQNFESLRRKYVARKSASMSIQKEIEDVLLMSEKVKEYCSDEEFVGIEPIFRKRIVTVLNKEISPDPVTLFTPPKASVISKNLDSEYKLKQQVFSVSDAVKRDIMQESDAWPSLYSIYQEPHKFADIISVDHLKSEKGSESSVSVPQDMVTVNMTTDSDTSVDKTKGAIPKAKKKRSKAKKNKVDSSLSSQKNSQFSDLLGNGTERNSIFSNTHNDLNQMNHRPDLLAYQMSHRTGPASVSSFFGASTESLHSDVPVLLQKDNQMKSVSSPKKTKASGKPDHHSNQSFNWPVTFVTIAPKWRLDTKIEGDLKQAFLTSVHPASNNRVVVSDSNNNKIKVFDIEGHFLEFYDVYAPTSVAYIAGVLSWSSGNDVIFQSLDSNHPFQRKLTFQSQEVPHPVSWFPKKHCIVGNGNHVRLYQVIKEEGKLTRVEQMSFETPDGQPLTKIINAKCDHQGHHLVLTDWDKKAFIFVDVKQKTKTVTGMFKGDHPAPWLPGGACFDHKGNVFALDYTGNRLLHLNNSGQLLQQWNTSPTINKPWCVSCSAHKHLFITGNDQFVHVYDYTYNG